MTGFATVLAVVAAGQIVAVEGRHEPLVRRPVAQTKLVERARSYLGVDYRWGGRNGQGLDCIGLVFRAIADVYGVPTRKFDRHNGSNAAIASLLGRERTLVLARELEAKPPALRDGDVLLFLWPNENAAEPHFAEIAGAPHWVWHVGLATTGGTAIHASPWDGRVVEEPLARVVLRHGFTGVVIVSPSR